MAGEQTRVLLFWHSMMNKGLTLVSNMFCNLNLTDMETCTRSFARTSSRASHPLRPFGFEPEIVMKSAKRKLRIYEVPISYHGRTYEEGKKVGWKDGLRALAVIFKFLAHRRPLCRPIRPRRSQQSHRHAPVSELARAEAPAVRGRRSPGVGAGIGNIAGSSWPDGCSTCRGERSAEPPRVCATAFCVRPTWWSSASTPKFRPTWPASKAASIRCFA